MLHSSAGLDISKDSGDKVCTSGVSVVVIPYNEEKKIGLCLKAVSWVDEIVVVDLGSTDGTVDICRKYTNKIYSQPWEPFADPVRDYGASRSSGRWILYLDPDEYVSPQLARSIQRIVAEDWPWDVISFEFHHVRFGEVLWHSEALSSTLVPRLFRRGVARWPSSVHRVPAVDGLRTLELRGSEYGFVEHDTWPHVNDVIDRYARYTQRDAGGRYERGERYSTAGALASSGKEFLSVFVQQGSYRDGVPGFFYALAMMMYRLLVWMQLWEREGRTNKKDSLIPLMGRLFRIPLTVLLWLRVGAQHARSAGNRFRR